MSNLPRAYLRLDPNLDAHPDPLTMVMLMVFANRQPKRGRFKSLDLIRKVVGKKKLEAAIERKDIVESDGFFFVAGWDEWQEGDLTVGERMQRVRNRRALQDKDLRERDRNHGVTRPSPKRIHASKTIDVDVDVETEPPPARAEEPDAVNAECQALAADLVKALQRAKAVTGLDGAEVLAHPMVRGKSSPITNPMACSEPARKLWRITAERVYGYIAAWEADQRERAAKRAGPKRGGAPAWDRGIEHLATEAEIEEWDHRLGPRPNLDELKATTYQPAEQSA